MNIKFYFKSLQILINKKHFKMKLYKVYNKMNFQAPYHLFSWVSHIYSKSQLDKWIKKHLFLLLNYSLRPNKLTNCKIW